MENIFKIAFEFNGEQPEDIDYINKALASMRFSDLKVDKILAGCMYFYDEHDEQGVKEPERRPVIHKILFECVCDDSENMHRYQIGAAALKRNTNDGADKFHDMWSKKHPNHVMRYMWHSHSDISDIFVFLYHEKVFK